MANPRGTPKNLRPFPKGHPGGPGRPKLEFVERIRQLSPLAEKILEDALKSQNKSVKLRAMQEVFDRGWGRPKQTTELTGEEGNPIEFVVPDPKFKV